MAFPAISIGAYGFPLERATKIAIREVEEYLNNQNKGSSLENIIFFCFSDDAYISYVKALENPALDEAR